jgi:hypothetical protein
MHNVETRQLATAACTSFFIIKRQPLTQWHVFVDGRTPVHFKVQQLMYAFGAHLATCVPATIIQSALCGSGERRAPFGSGLALTNGVPLLQFQDALRQGRSYSSLTGSYVLCECLGIGGAGT